MKGAEQLARRGRPLARGGSGRASGETEAPGQRAPFPAARGLQASAAARSALCSSPRCSRAQLRTMPLPTSSRQRAPFRD